LQNKTADYSLFINNSLYICIEHYSHSWSLPINCSGLFHLLFHSG